MNFNRVKNYIAYIKRNIKYSVSVNTRVIDVGSGHVPLVRADGRWSGAYGGDGGEVHGGS